MKLQLALDRVSIEEGIALAQAAGKAADWIEVGTSLIKEFGMESVRRFRAALPNAVLLADMKIIDNARYECRLAFSAGADIVTVMGASPVVTIQTVLEEAAQAGKTVVIDLLNTDAAQQQMLCDAFPKAVFCIHTSKDEQEAGNGGFQAGKTDWSGRRIAVAGGVTQEALPEIAARYQPEVVIVGGAITQAADPAAAARAFGGAMREIREK